MVESGSATATTSPDPTSHSSSLPTLEPATRATYRGLILRGLAPDEAASLTAYLAGIGLGGTRWTLRQINQLLFLRAMNRTGYFTRTSDRIH